MPGLLIKELPAPLHQRLKDRAARHRRSLGREALTLLEEALADRAGPPALAEIDALRVRGEKPLTQRLLNRARDTGRS